MPTSDPTPTPTEPTATTLTRLQALLMKDYPLHIGRLGADEALADLGIDSLGVAELMFKVEDEFKLRLSSEPVTITTIGDVACLIDALLAAQHGELPGSAHAGSVAAAAAVAHPPPAH